MICPFCAKKRWTYYLRWSPFAADAGTAAAKKRAHKPGCPLAPGRLAASQRIVQSFPMLTTAATRRAVRTDGELACVELGQAGWRLGLVVVFLFAAAFIVILVAVAEVKLKKLVVIGLILVISVSIVPICRRNMLILLKIILQNW
jgi:hypothetical protein